ncbi:hypothetical protein HYC85_025677 [Camellia sinensis]|uniref:PGG domain-containing protein n=1 Tax=Camellia sinensis TaxID=4442 RepID=A0A7J7GE18_CAMSI|nr:hypothetical protein HYC85_025677 [Camellia sinensis]
MPTCHRQNHLFHFNTHVLIYTHLTSRYAENDFLESLPFKLMIGLTTLFISITTMMVAFGATFFIVFDHYTVWVPIAVALFACVPIILFVTLQYPLLADVIHSTYGSRRTVTSWGTFSRLFHCEGKNAAQLNIPITHTTEAPTNQQQSPNYKKSPDSATVKLPEGDAVHLTESGSSSFILGAAPVKTLFGDDPHTLKLIMAFHTHMLSLLVDL